MILNDNGAPIGLSLIIEQYSKVIEAAMNPTDPQSFFGKWLTAYCDRLHLVKRVSPIDLAQPDAPKPSISVSPENIGDTTSTPRKPTSA